MMKVRAAVLRATGAAHPYVDSQPLRIETIELAPPQDGEVLVRIAAAGLCHSDLSVINGDRPRPLPMVLGHEAAGIVEALGPGLTDLTVGDHVILVFVPSCGHCRPCAEGRPALCEPAADANRLGELLGGGSRLSQNVVRINHHLGCSAFSDRVVLARRSLVKIDRELPLEIAALFGCAVLTGVGAVVNTAQVKAGETVAIIGLGGVGLAAVLGAVAAGAAQVIAIDVNPEKLAFAQSLGATTVVDARDPRTIEEIRGATDGGVDHALEFAGSILALRSAIAITRRGGSTITAGLPPPDQMLPLDIVGLVGEERTLKGSYIGSCVPSRDIPRYIALYRAGKLPVDRLMSGVIGLDEINAGFDSLRDGSVVRQIVRMR
jgi:alcohol dehydrogenase